MSSLGSFRGFTGFHDCRHNFKCLRAAYIFQWMSQMNVSNWISHFFVLLFCPTFAKAPLRLGSHGQLIEAIIVDSVFNQWCPKQNPHPMFLWLLCAMHHTFPAICPLNILWAALLLQSHQFLHRKTEGERKRERDLLFRSFTIRPNENPCLEQLPSSRFLWQLRYKTIWMFYLL